MIENLEIRRIKSGEIHLIKDFPPEDWHLDLSSLYRFHSGEKYFYPSVALVDLTIAGTGMVILNKDVAWLGTIIVKEEYRKRGIGSAITEHLIKWSKANGGRRILLIATELGRLIYEKLGFRQSMDYIVFKDGILKKTSESKNISKINLKDYKEILSIDKDASGEDRNRIIQKTYLTGYKYLIDNQITGYYLPDFGNGLIIAKHETAGIELIKYKYLRDGGKLVVPELNTAVIAFLRENGFKEYAKIPRMFLDSDVTWKQEMIFSRGSGYLG